MNRTIIGAGLAIAIIAALSAWSAASTTAQQEIDPADFSPVITNALFPLSLVGPRVLEGDETDPDTGEVVVERLESRVLPDTSVIAGVTVTVLEERAYKDGELVEVAQDHFAQHSDGSVWYFGEFVDNYEDGELTNHDGQWFAGEGENEPGIIMPAQPVVGQTYQQESAPGLAEDMATVLSLNETVTVPSGTYQNCMHTREFTPLEPGIEEFKWHCPGVGLAREEGADSVIELISIEPAPASAASPTPPPAPTAAPPQPTAVPPAGVVAPNTGDGSGSNSGTSDGYAWLLAAVAGAGLLAGASGVVTRGRTRPW